MSGALDKFLKYVTFDTQSVEDSGETPSSPGQKKLGDYIAGEARAMGLADASCDRHSYVVATMPSNVGDAAPTVALIAHLDTSSEVSGENVKPRIVKYTGEPIKLDDGGKFVLSEADFPELARQRGREIVVTDGSTLLGADDKAGVAAIMGAAAWFMAHPDAPRGTVKLVFTPDEEIGHSAALLDLEKLGADFAYTLDGGELGELCWENFNAARAKITVTGRSVHTGDAKGKMKNAVTILNSILAKLPDDETPETTEGREGFYHVMSESGGVELATASILIRDHSTEKFDARQKYVEKIVADANAKFGDVASVEIDEQYLNMADVLRDKGYILDVARDAMRRANVEPLETPVRGGTDGARLSYRGLPTPNIFTGGMNFHGRYEYIPVEDLEKSCEVVRNIISICAGMKK